MKKKHLLLTLSILIFNPLFSQNDSYKQTSTGITFKVSDVEPATELIDEISYQEALEYRLGTNLEGFQLSEKGKTLIPTDAHGFVSALHICFAQHRPMVISPDMIWLMICQGVATHIEQNADSLRHLFVDFKEKKKIKILRNEPFLKGNPNNDWLKVFPEISDSVKAYLKDSLYQLVVPNFSTTGIKEKAAFEITFLISVNKYFNCVVETLCGIPEITLEGKTEDWIWIRKNAEKYRKYKLDKWIDNLIPLLDEFVNASKGEINLKFWQSIYKWASDSGGPYITGWIIKFFPYLIETNSHVYPNKFIDKNKFLFHGIKSDNLPSGLSKVNFTWLIRVPGLPQTDFPMEMYAGFMGIGQDKQTKALRPEISWAIVDSLKKRFKEAYDTIKTIEIVDDSIEVEVIRLISEDISPKIFSKYKLVKKDGLFFMHPFEIYPESEKSKKNMNPVFFPDLFSSYYESENYLIQNIKESIGKKKYKAFIEFDISWVGTIENIRVNSQTNPELNQKVIELLRKIPCKPGTYSGINANFNVQIPPFRF